MDCRIGSKSLATHGSLGVTTAEKVDIDSLAQRLRKEGLEKRGAMTGPLLIGAFAWKPHTA